MAFLSTGPDELTPLIQTLARTYHNPRSVDAYPKAFDSALIRHVDGLPLRLMASVLRHRESLIQEYLELIGAYLRDPDTMREHLCRQSVTVPLYVSNSG